jgi:microcystin degradation protein MlrC
VILVETSDCCGGGAAGDSVHSLRALLDAGVAEPCLVPVVDPEVAEACWKAGAGAELEVRIGHAIDPKWGKPISLRGKVERLSDGKFFYRGGTWEGVQAEMGMTAVLAVGAVRVLVTTHGTYDWRDEQFRAVSLEPERAKFVVAKNPMNYRMAYGAFAKECLVLDTPGPTPPTLRHVRYRNVARPYFPAVDDIPGLEPTILRGR